MATVASGLRSVAQRVDKRSKSGRGLSSARVVQVVAGIGRTPLLEHAREKTRRDVGQGEVVRNVCNAQPGQGRVEALARSVERGLALHVNAEFAAPAREFPGA